MIASVGDAVQQIIELIPSAKAIVANHRASLGEFGPAPDPASGVAVYSLFTELRIYVFRELEDGRPLDEEKLCGLYKFIEEAIDSPDGQVSDAVSIRVIQKLYRYEPAIRSAKIKPGPKLRKLLIAEDTIDP